MPAEARASAGCFLGRGFTTEDTESTEKRRKEKGSRRELNAEAQSSQRKRKRKARKRLTQKPQRAQSSQRRGKRRSGDRRSRGEGDYNGGHGKQIDCTDIAGDGTVAGD